MELQPSPALPALQGSKPTTGALTLRRRTEARPAERLYLLMCRAVETPLAVLLLLAIFVATNLGRALGGFEDFLALRVTVKNLLLLLGFALTWRLTSAAFRVYCWHNVRTRHGEAARLLLLCTFMCGLALIFPLMSVTGAFGYLTVLWFWVASIVVFLGVRVFFRSLAARNVAPVRDVLIVGSGPRAVELFERVAEESDDRRVVGFVDTVNGAPLIWFGVAC